MFSRDCRTLAVRKATLSLQGLCHEMDISFEGLKQKISSFSMCADGFQIFVILNLILKIFALALFRGSKEKMLTLKTLTETRLLF